MNVLVLGNGGREHAIVHAITKSSEKVELHSAPGNPGIAQLATCHHANITSTEEVLALCKKLRIELVVIGPEAPLVSGVTDSLRSNGIFVFGPGKSGAQLEGSKAYAKRFMSRYGIPTAAFDICETLEECDLALGKRTPPYVIKADGLASGKGVFLPDSLAEARIICQNLIHKRSLGDAGATLVIEDFSPGTELTLLAMTDGHSALMLPPSQDHKRAFDGDKGPNTGGMGAYAPVPWVTEELLNKIRTQILYPTLAGLKQEGIPYCGVLYMGLMLFPNGDLSLLEYNVRMGDPETQAVLPLFAGDFFRAILACCQGDLHNFHTQPVQQTTLGVVLASKGYPEAPEAGYVIHGLDHPLNNAYVYHAATQEGADKQLYTSGGRVLTVVGMGENLKKAHEAAYSAVQGIRFEGMHFRKDIGKGALKHE